MKHQEEAPYKLLLEDIQEGIFNINTTRKLINTNGNTEGITVGKKLKQRKKNDDMSFLPTELPMESPTEKFRR
jgi:hypothetical protein